MLQIDRSDCSCANVVLGKFCGGSIFQKLGSCLLLCRTRQVKDVDFQFVLSGIPGVENVPLKPRKSGRARRTTQTELLPQRTSRQTPQRKVVSDARKSTRATPKSTRKVKGEALDSGLVGQKNVEKVSGWQSVHNDLEGPVTKKRRVSKELACQTDRGLGYKSSLSDMAILQVRETDPSSGLQGLDLEQAPSEVGRKKRKKRRSIGQNSIKKRRTTITFDKEEDREGLANGATNVTAECPPRLLTADLNSEQQLPAVTSPEASVLTKTLEVTQAVKEEKLSSDRSLVEQAKARPKRRRRKPIAQIRKPRKKAPASPKINKQPETLTHVKDLAEKRSLDEKSLTTISRRRGRPKKPVAVVESAILHEKPKDASQELSEPTRLLKKRGRPKLSSMDKVKRAVKDLPTSSSTNVNPGSLENSIPTTAPCIRPSDVQVYSDTESDHLSNTFFAKGKGINAVNPFSNYVPESVSDARDRLGRTSQRKFDKIEKTNFKSQRGKNEVFRKESDTRPVQVVSTGYEI